MWRGGGRVQLANQNSHTLIDDPFMASMSSSLSHLFELDITFDAIQFQSLFQHTCRPLNTCIDPSIPSIIFRKNNGECMARVLGRFSQALLDLLGAGSARSRLRSREACRTSCRSTKIRSTTSQTTSNSSAVVCALAGTIHVDWLSLRAILLV